MKRLLVFVVLVAMVGGGYLAGYMRAADYAESEYYRGIYDMCVWTGMVLFEDPESRVACIEAVQLIREQDWRGQPSEGYEPRLPPAPDEVPAVPKAPVDQDWQAQPREGYEQ